MLPDDPISECEVLMKAGQAQSTRPGKLTSMEGTNSIQERPGQAGIPMTQLIDERTRPEGERTHPESHGERAPG